MSNMIHETINETNNDLFTLVARDAVATSIDDQGNVRFDHPNLINGWVWIGRMYREVCKEGDKMDIYYCYVPHYLGWYVARRRL